MTIPTKCELCPRKCGANRNTSVGFCGGENTPRVALCALHLWEEPCISGKNGSGTVFFAGCGLGCIFCQNHAINKGGVGKVCTTKELAQEFLALQSQNAHNINLVTASHYLPWVQNAVLLAREKGLTLPIVWNTGGYETLEAIHVQKTFTNVWLFDLKFYSAQLSEKLAGAKNYFEVASKAIIAACDAAGPVAYNEAGIMQRGTILRLLVLPGQVEDANAILFWAKENLPKENFILSLMCQYTPPSGANLPKPLHRPLASYEYNKVVTQAIKLGFTNGYLQQRASIGESYTPEFML